MQDDEHDATRVARPGAASDAGPGTDEPDPNMTQIMRPSPRASEAAEALKLAQSRRDEHEDHTPEWSGEIDFDVTAETDVIIEPPRARARIVAWTAGFAGVAVVAFIAWWFAR